MSESKSDKAKYGINVKEEVCYDSVYDDTTVPLLVFDFWKEHQERPDQHPPE